METQRQLSQAEALSQEFTGIMSKQPENHTLWLNLLAAVEAYYLGIPGPHGGRPAVANQTYERLDRIHLPLCPDH